MTVRSTISALCLVLIGFVAQVCSAVAAEPTTDEAVSLRSGHMGNYLWASFIEQPELPAERNAGRVCLAISMLEPAPGNRAEGNEVATCQSPPSDRPLIEDISGGFDGKVRTAIAVIFPTGVRSVKLKIKGQPAQTVRTQEAYLPSTFNVDERSVPYIGRGYTHRVCIERIEGYDAKGVRITALGRRSCV